MSKESKAIINDGGNSIGERLTQFRIQADMSQAELAELAEISRQYLGNIERGEVSPRIDTIGKLADVIGTSINTLLDIRIPSNAWDNPEYHDVHNQLQRLLETYPEALDYARTSLRAMNLYFAGKKKGRGK